MTTRRAEKSGEGEFTSEGGKRGLLGGTKTKMNFMRLRNESKLTMILVEISTEIIYRSEYLCQSGSVGVSKYQALT